jgi:NADH-quinone oxidoreductase subunit M
VQDEHHRSLTDATWEERLSTATLIFAVAAIGCFPNFFIDIIKSSFDPVVKALQQTLPNVL